MPRNSKKNGVTAVSAQAKYDAHNTVLQKTYGVLADLRRELADSKSAVAERTELLQLFSQCQDSQRAWLLLEDYFSKLSLARKDFSSNDWWPRMMAVSGSTRLEELALLFLRYHRSLPTELVSSANLDRLAQLEEAEQDQQLAQQLEQWMFPPTPTHLDAPRASVRIVCTPQPQAPDSPLMGLGVQLYLHRPRNGERIKTVAEMTELTLRAAHEQELFSIQDWAFIQWLADHYGKKGAAEEELLLTGTDLLKWVATWGNSKRLLLAGTHSHLGFVGQIAELIPALARDDEQLFFTHELRLSNGEVESLDHFLFFGGQPGLVLSGNTVYLLKNAPAPELLENWLRKNRLPLAKLSHRFLGHLRKINSGNGNDWDKICIAHTAKPQFIFELTDEVVRLRLVARSDRDESTWQWNGLDWQLSDEQRRKPDKPEFLDDPRLHPPTQWLRRLDWFTPEPGLWVGDAQESFMNSLAEAWPMRPADADYLGNPAFQRLFLSPRKLKPRLILSSSGIDWFSVSAEWEQEGLRLSPADLQRLAAATSHFVKLPDSGWVELDAQAVLAAHEAMADLGLDGLCPIPQQVNIASASQLSDATLQPFGGQAEQIKEQIRKFDGIPPTAIPSSVQAELRPYQKEGFDFLCHLSRLKMGGILADDMGLGKTLQTLAWLAWSKERSGANAKPVLVICPASVLHNWRREANRFAPSMRVLVLESGAERHNLRQQIPQHDLIVTNYSLLRRDLESLQKFGFRAVILDEAQFIKNPSAQVTQSVKQLKTEQRLALTGTPLENRLLDLWSILDFSQPGYLGTQADFNQKYDPPGQDDINRSIARRRLSARLRPLMLRRLKRQVAKDLPDRIEERRDCDLGETQRKLYLAELRRSREQVFQTVADKGINKSQIHVLAALTRLRQICCHPQLVGSDSPSGKTDTLFELLETLIAEGQKVLVFSQFVEMLKLLQAECASRQIPTHMLTGATKERQEVVQAFQNDDQPGVFLLSLRAAGTGLNLTSASYVVLYDPWWNPAVEAQAIDRSHRIGQTRTVIAYRLIAPGTVEEKIWDLQQKKSQTIADVLGEEGFARSLTKTDLEYLFAED